MRVKGYPRSWWQNHFKKPLLRCGLQPTHMKYLNTLIVRSSARKHTTGGPQGPLCGNQAFVVS